MFSLKHLQGLLCADPQDSRDGISCTAKEQNHMVVKLKELLQLTVMHLWNFSEEVILGITPTISIWRNTALLWRFNGVDNFTQLLLFFFWLHHVASGISVSWLGIKPGPWQWKHGILTTMQPGNSHCLLLLQVLKGPPVFVPCVENISLAINQRQCQKNAQLSQQWHVLLVCQQTSSWGPRTELDRLAHSSRKPSLALPAKSSVIPTHPHLLSPHLPPVLEGSVCKPGSFSRLLALWGKNVLYSFLNLCIQQHKRSKKCSTNKYISCWWGQSDEGEGTSRKVRSKSQLTQTSSFPVFKAKGLCH